MRERAERAEEEHVPLLVRLRGTGWFAVRDGAKFNCTIIGEWGHVKSDSIRALLQCKVNERVVSGLPVVPC